MKKRIIHILLFAILVISLAGCGGKDDGKAEERIENIIDEIYDNADKADEEHVEEVAVSETDDEENIEASEAIEEPEEEAAAEEDIDEASEEEDLDSQPKLYFETVDIYGNAVSFDDFKDYKVIMINFWEPWCGPCVGEMPDLEILYEKYKDQGFIIIGAFSTEGMDEDVLDVMEECNTQYPIVRAVASMEEYMTEYVPTTVFVDNKGRLLLDEPIVGSNSYSNWENTIKNLLKN